MDPRQSVFIVDCLKIQAAPSCWGPWVIDKSKVAGREFSLRRGDFASRYFTALFKPLDIWEWQNTV